MVVVTAEKQHPKVAELPRFDGSPRHDLVKITAQEIRDGGGKTDEELLSAFSKFEMLGVLSLLDRSMVNSADPRLAGLIDAFSGKYGMPIDDVLRVIVPDTPRGLHHSPPVTSCEWNLRAIQIFKLPVDNDLLRNLIAKNWEMGTPPSEEELSRFSITLETLRPGRLVGSIPKVAGEWPAFADKTQPYFDTPGGWCLRKDGKIIASLSVWPERDNPSVLQMHQLQGFREKVWVDDGAGNLKIQQLPDTWGLRGFDWRAAMIAYAEEQAKKVGFTKFGILSAMNNRWCEADGGGDTHMDRKVALKRYDEVAERLGYTRRGPEFDTEIPIKWWNWTKDLA
jgi:hypothetical protein